MSWLGILEATHRNDVRDRFFKINILSLQKYFAEVPKLLIHRLSDRLYAIGRNMNGRTPSRRFSCPIPPIHFSEKVRVRVGWLGLY